jgi:putative transposase
MASIRGAVIDHATLQRWLIRFVPLIDKEVRKRKRPIGSSWRMDETYIKINGKWVYLYRAVDSCGNTIEFLLRKYRDAIAAKAFFRKAFKNNHRFIKKRTKPMLGFKSFRSAKITIAGIESIRIIQKGQIIGSNNNVSTFENFKMLMAS